MYSVYLLRCSDGTLYCGIAKDPQKRLVQHNAGKGAKYTRGRLPVAIVYQEEVRDRSHALKREYAIKKLSRSEKLQLINKPVKSLQSTVDSKKKRKRVKSPLPAGDSKRKVGSSIPQERRGAAAT